MYAGDTCTAQTEEVLANSKNQLFEQWLRFWPNPNSIFFGAKDAASRRTGESESEFWTMDEVFG